MIKKLPPYWRRGHLWEDGTWDERGGHWIFMPEWYLPMLSYRKPRSRRKKGVKK